ncbi:hypothetical protein [Umezawaea tangerina]|uniref:Helix-turn-helix protein n=1 Tax=Umezawaea tangerina TaxID=84725 RepID=A0A2T0SPE9_9PSEU|nr:hypothetical protein [Umezawaea tangerina]PRY35285.1 hypothetical protein CLV43_114203 [Umezawaea tangerina]
MAPEPEEVELIPEGRFNWERVVRRIEMPKALKLVALLLATTADADGSRVKPGYPLLGAWTGDTERNVGRLVKKLRDLGLLNQVSRGGGRGGEGKTAVYQLTLPSDLLDRVTLLDPDGRVVSRGKQTELPVSPDTQVSGETGSPLEGNNSVSGDIQMSGQSPVDNPNDTTSDVVTDRLTGHFESIDRTPGCPTTKDQPPKRPTPDLDPAQPQHARRAPRAKTISPSTVKCRPHGLAGGAYEDGTPRCALCRRDALGVAS